MQFTRYMLLACLALPLWAGQTYVALSQLNLVRISADGNSVTNIASNLNLRDLAQEPTGNYVGSNVNKIQRITPAGNVSTLAAAPAGSQFISLVVDGYGNTIVADNQRHVLWRITPDGLSVTQIATYPVLDNNQLEDVLVRIDSSGNYIVAHDNSSAIRLYRITPQGAVTPIPLAGNYTPSQITGLTLDTAGNYYVFDSGAGRLLKIAPNGVFSAIASGSQFPAQPFGLAFNAITGEIVVSATGLNKLVRVSTDGTVITPITTGIYNVAALVDYGTDTSSTSGALKFFPVTPCRVVDTRAGQGTSGVFGPPSLAPGVRSFPISSGNCGVPLSAKAYSLNVTVVPQGALPYLTMWPTGIAQPTVSTLNSYGGKILANAAIVPAGTGGSVSVFSTGGTDLILDVNGYFDTPSVSGLGFFPITPCRVLDTRLPTGTFGGPQMFAGQTRDFPVPTSNCGLPAGAQAYSLNATVVPTQTLQYLTLWPTNLSRPLASTLNSFDGRTLANAAIVPAAPGTGSISAFVTNATDLILDANGYFGGAASGLNFYAVPPCRIADTRQPNGPFGGPIIPGFGIRDFPVPGSACGIPSTARAFSLNVTVVPPNPLGYITVWPTGQTQPFVSTLNAGDGAITANAAIVPSGISGSVSVFATQQTHVLLDINGYFAP